jgi:hypothetical protein
MNRYYRPTPLKWRKIGDTLLAVSTTITTFAIAEDVQWLAYVALFIGVVGKFLTNLFVRK